MKCIRLAVEVMMCITVCVVVKCESYFASIYVDIVMSVLWCWILRL